MLRFRFRIQKGSDSSREIARGTDRKPFKAEKLEGPERSWLKDLFLPGQAAKAYARTHGGHIDEIMSHDVTTIGEDAGLEEAVELMEHHRVKRLPVVAGDNVVGIVTRADFVRGLVEFVRQSYDEPLASDAEI